MTRHNSHVEKMSDRKKPHKRDKSFNKQKIRRRDFCQKMRSYLDVLIYWTRYFTDLLIDFAYGLYYDPKKLAIPSSNDPIILQSAVSLAKKIRKGELKSEDVVKAFITRTREVNQIINAVVDERFSEALEEARKIDKEIATGTIIDADFQEKPFLGLPFTAKESTSVKGLSNTFGLLKRKGRKATFDADCVRLMKEAGAICIGVTNVPQLNYWQETSNPVFGVTNNPYNTTRNVGGSSGGESSILAACGSLISLGTDIGGSIRIPAFMCGVFGHKPTSGLTSTKGLTFRSGKESQTMVVVGPLAKHAEDLAPVLNVLLGSNASKLKLNQPVNISNIKIFYVTDPNDALVSPFYSEMKTTIAKTIDYFKEFSNEEPEALDVKGFKNGAKLWRYWMTQEETNFLMDLNDQKAEVNAIKEILSHFLFLSGEYTTATIYNLINKFLPKVDGKWAKEETEKLRNAIIDKLGDNGVLLYPSAPFSARYHHTALLRPFNFNLFSIFNALQLPVTQVPLGLDSENLPVGIQVVAAPYQDHLAIAVAKQLEQQFGGFVPPFKTD